MAESDYEKWVMHFNALRAARRVLTLSQVRITKKRARETRTLFATDRLVAGVSRRP